MLLTSLTKITFLIIIVAQTIFRSLIVLLLLSATLFNQIAAFDLKCNFGFINWRYASGEGWAFNFN